VVVSSPTPLGMSMLHVRGATTTARPSPPLPARVGICWNNYALSTNDSRPARSCVVVLFGVLSDRKAGRSTYLGGGAKDKCIRMEILEDCKRIHVAACCALREHPARPTFAGGASQCRTRGCTSRKVTCVGARMWPGGAIPAASISRGGQLSPRSRTAARRHAAAGWARWRAFTRPPSPNAAGSLGGCGLMAPTSRQPVGPPNIHPPDVFLLVLRSR